MKNHLEARCWYRRESTRALRSVHESAPVDIAGGTLMAIGPSRLGRSHAPRGDHVLTLAKVLMSRSVVIAKKAELNRSELAN